MPPPASSLPHRSPARPPLTHSPNPNIIMSICFRPNRRSKIFVISNVLLSANTLILHSIEPAIWPAPLSPSQCNSPCPFPSTSPPLYIYLGVCRLYCLNYNVATDMILCNISRALFSRKQSHEHPKPTNSTWYHSADIGVTHLNIKQSVFYS